VDTQRFGEALIRILLILGGAFFLTRPAAPAPDATSHRGQVEEKALGALLLLLAVVRYGKPEDRRGTPGPS
jgi:hypothetical protein